MKQILSKKVIAELSESFINGNRNSVWEIISENNQTLNVILIYQKLLKIKKSSALDFLDFSKHKLKTKEGLMPSQMQSNSVDFHDGDDDEEDLDEEDLDEEDLDEDDEDDDDEDDFASDDEDEDDEDFDDEDEDEDDEDDDDDDDDDEDDDDDY